MGRRDDVQEGQARRLRLHRLRPSRPLRDARGAAAFIRERQIVMSTGHSSLPVLSEAIAGRAIAGSWMADPEAGRIYDILGRVRRQDIIAAPLVLGKEVLMTPGLGPAVQRVAADGERCERVRGRLPAPARKLLAAVEAEGSVRMDTWGPAARWRPARTLLERELLVAGNEIHTEGGYHTSIVKPWRAGPIAGRFDGDAARLTYEAAQEALVRAAVWSAVVAPEREVRRWFVFGGDRLDELLARGIFRRLSERRRDWITIREGGRA